METTAADISRLVSDLEGLAVSSNPGPESSLPSLQQLYRLGLLLFQITHNTNTNTKYKKSIDQDPVVIAYRELIESIPDENLLLLFADLRKASQRLLASSSINDNGDARDLALAVRSIEGLISAFSDRDSQTCATTESNSRLCRVAYDSSWISTLSALFDRFIVFEKQQRTHNNGMAGTEIELIKRAILSCLSRLVLDGLVLVGDTSISISDGAAATVEESLLEAIRCMEEESTDCLRDLQAWQSGEEPYRRTLECSLRAIEISSTSNSNSSDEDEALERAQQREYIASMLESARGEPSSMSVPASRKEAPNRSHTSASASTPAKRPMSSSSPADTELDRRVKQVLQILPHFGEGFVEVALGLYKGDVEATVATLLSHPLPTALRVLDPKLPRRKREFKTYQTAEEEASSAEAARKDVKDRIALEEKQKRDQYEALILMTDSQQQQQEKAEAATSTQASETVTETASAASDKKLTRKELRQRQLKQRRRIDEYDDDYDDQYDEIDIKLGAADDGFTSDNLTFEQVKLYNQVVQEDESDVAYWESNRNTNQKAGGGGKGNGEKKWGSDKIKGGRVIGADGKIVRKPGGVKKKKTNNRNNNNNTNNNANNNTNSNSNNSNNSSSNNNNNSNSNNNKNQVGKPKANSNNNKSKNNANDNANANANTNTNTNANTAAKNGTKKKPKTKPRSDNRVNRQRDRKFQKQGTFGVQD